MPNNPYLKITLLGTFFFLSFSLAAQSNRGELLFEVSPTDGTLDVQLKWFRASTAILSSGSNVYYRTDVNQNWTQANEYIVYPDKGLKQVLIEQDSLDAFYTEAAEDFGIGTSDEFLLANIFIRSFQSNQYSQFLGNYFHFSIKDIPETVQFLVKSYRYGQEVELARSEVIEVDTKADLPTSFDFKWEEKKGVIKFKWVPDDSDFYGVNILRRGPLENEFRKVNQQAVVAGLKEEDDGSFKLPDFLYQDTVSENSKYDYKLQAIGYFENIVAESEVTEITTKDYTPPKRVYGLQRKLKDGYVELNWINPDVIDYEELYVMRSNNSEAPFERLNGKSLPLFTTQFLDEIEPGQTYYYYVQTVDEAGNTNRSNMVLIEVMDLLPPAPPSGLTIESDTGKIFLSWSANSERDLMGYRIYRGVENEALNNYVLLNANPIAETQFEDSLPKNAGNKFLYYAVAVDSSINMSEPSERVSAYLPDVTAPGSPFIYDVAENQGRVVISWEPSVESDVESYQVHMISYGNDSTPALIGQSDANSRKFVHDGLNSGDDYGFYVTSSDMAGNVSEPSNTVIIKIGTIVSQTDLTLSGEFDVNADGNALSWKVEDSDEILGYYVYRSSTTEDDFKAISGLVKEDSFLDVKAPKGGTYNYKIIEYKKNGLKQESNEIQISTL